MPNYVALLRGVNVGGSGRLSMKDLRDICAAEGLTGVRTYIQSGNVVFESGHSEADIRSRLEPVLKVKVGKSVDVMVRTAEEMSSILSGNPFPEENPAKVAVAFLHGLAPSNQLQGLIGPDGEVVRAGKREIYTFYPNGMGRSKLKLPLKGDSVTVRNINTVAMLVALAASRGS